MTEVSKNENPTEGNRDLAKENAETKELNETRKLCARYHNELDHTKYFDSKAIDVASALLPPFKSINRELLPASVKLVVRHRLAYLTFISSLKSNPAIGRFLDSVKENIGDVSLLLKTPKDFYEKVKDKEEFQALGLLDFRLILSGLHVSLNELGEVNNSTGAWDQDADNHLRENAGRDADNRVDDKMAASNLQKGFEKMQEFVLYAEMKKIQDQI